MSLAPILLFAYNRPRLLAQTLASLSANELARDSVLYIYCDGPANQAAPESREAVQEVRRLCRKADWPRELHVIESEKNRGLAASVIEGVTATVNRYGKVIVVEDDVLLSPFFLRFMNDALDQYAHDENVLSIGSWNYFCDPGLLKDNFFLRYPDSIAWGTFRRAWNLFEKDAALLLEKLKEKKKLKNFNCNLREKYFENMLVNQLEGKIDSWAIRWTATSVLHDKLNFYPRHSLSKHAGFGTDATHESLTHDYNRALVLADKPVPVRVIPLKESETAILMWKRFVRREFLKKKSLAARIISRLKRIQ